MSHKYLTLNERNKIEVLNKEGYYSRRIVEIRLNEMGFIFQNTTMLRNLNIYENIILPGLKSGKSHKKK